MQRSKLLPASVCCMNYSENEGKEWHCWKSQQNQVWNLGVSGSTIQKELRLCDLSARQSRYRINTHMLSVLPLASAVLVSSSAALEWSACFKTISTAFWSSTSLVFSNTKYKGGKPYLIPQSIRGHNNKVILRRQNCVINMWVGFHIELNCTLKLGTGLKQQSGITKVTPHVTFSLL